MNRYEQGIDLCGVSCIPIDAKPLNPIKEKTP